MKILTFFDFLPPLTLDGLFSSLARSIGFGGGVAGGILLIISREFSDIGSKLNSFLYSFLILNASSNPPNVNYFKIIFKKRVENSSFNKPVEFSIIIKSVFLLETQPYYDYKILLLIEIDRLKTILNSY